MLCPYSHSSIQRVEEVLITLCPLRAGPVLMHFLLSLLSFFSLPLPPFPSLLPLPAFQLTLGFGKSYLPFDPDQSPSYLQPLNHKHFIAPDGDTDRHQGFLASAGGGRLDAGL